MAYIPGPAGLTRCAINWTQNGERCVNVIYVDREALSVQAAADAVQDAFGTNLAPALNNNTTMDFVTATDVGPALGVVRFSSAAPVAGTATAQAMPNDKAVVATLRTFAGGRSGRGRIYIMGMTIGDITDADPNHITAARAATLTTVMNNVSVDLVTAGVTWGVASYYSGVDAGGHPIPRAAAVFNPLEQIHIDTRIDTQRRRLPRS